VADAADGATRGGHVKAGGLRWRRFAAGGFRWATLAFFAILLAFPFYWMLITSFKKTGDLYNMKNNPFIFNQAPTLEHITILSAPAAYSLTRLSGAWGERVGIGIFLTYLVPPTLLFIPLSRIVAWLGLQDSLWAIIVVYPSFTIPFSTWLLMGFFKSIPRELEDAAMVDGLTRFQVFVKLVIPISISGLLTVVIFTFTLVMQEFVYALTFISSAAHQTIGVGVPIYLVRGDVYYWGSLMAACLIATLPIAVLYNLFLDRFIAGFTVGSVK
jgi:multiple sugar transport system permease protein